MHDLLLNFHLPINDPTWIFFLVLCVILFAPLLLGRLRIPHIIGMILAGVLIGPHGLNLLLRDSSFELFGKVGIYYIMFLAGLEMDLEGFKRNKKNGLLFGVLTFTLPFAVGMFVGMDVLHFSVEASMLLSCIFASHTLVAYPIVGRYGVNRRTVVTLSIAATMVALLVSLVLLAGISGVFKGDSGWLFWLTFTAKCLIFCLGVIVLVPRLSRWFFRTFADQVMQYIYVLAVVFFCGGMAEVCGLEGIFGAFLAGLVLNRFIPHVSPLMNRIEFVGNALFIPYFLIGVGMLINIELLFQSAETLWVVFVMVSVGTLTKWMAAFLSCRLFHRRTVEGWMMFGLTEAHAAGALAMVMVGTKLEVAPGEYLMNDSVLNGVVMMILFSCIISTLATDYAARKMALEEEHSDNHGNDDEKILIPIRDADTMPYLVSLAMLMRNPKLNRGLIGLTVANDDEDELKAHARGKRLLEQAVKICAAADVRMQTQSRLAANIANGIIHALKENEASELIIGLHRRRSMVDSYYGALTKNLLNGMYRQLMIVKCTIPVNTLRRIVVVVPPKAEFESGFHRWIDRLARMATQLGCRICFHAPQATLQRIDGYVKAHYESIRTAYEEMEDWDDLMLFSTRVQDDHLLVFVLARRGSISYLPAFEHLPEQMKYFADCSCMMIFPDQFGGGGQDSITSFTEPQIPVPQRTLYTSLMDFMSGLLHKSE